MPGSNAALSSIQTNAATATGAKWGGRGMGRDNMAKYINGPTAAQEQVRVEGTDGCVASAEGGRNFDQSLAQKLWGQLDPTASDEHDPCTLQQCPHFGQRHGSDGKQFLLKTTQF